MCIRDSSITASRPLGFFAYAWGEMSEMPADTQSGMIGWFERCGFSTNPLTKICHSVEQLIAFHRKIEEQRSHLDYDIDGVVYKVCLLYTSKPRPPCSDTIFLTAPGTRTPIIL